MAQEELKAGLTGRFPDGKISSDDEGELEIIVGTEEEKGIIIIMFGKPTKWLGLHPEQVIAIADDLINKANMLTEAKTKKENNGPERLQTVPGT